VDARPGARIGPQAEIRPKRHADRRQRLDARLDLGGLDPPDMGWIDAGSRSELAERNARIKPQVMDVLARTDGLSSHAT
jgi:hypothetical protein